MDRLRTKFYLTNVPTANLISIGLGEQVGRLFTNCTLVKETNENMLKKHWSCDHVNIVDLSQIKTTDQAKEEFQIILTGMRPFGKEMRPSGFLSYNIMGRNYGRDDVEFDQQPHGLITAEPLPYAVETNLVAVPPTPDGIQRMYKELKQSFFQHSQALRDQDIKTRSFQEGYDTARALQIDPKQFAELTKRLEKCERDRRDQK